MDMNQYLQMFIEESNDNLQHLNENLLSLEHEPNDEQILNEIFRVAHTLKGMAGTMGFTKMQRLTHSVENVLSEIRAGKMQVNADMLDTLFQCLDALENYVAEITSTGTEGANDYPELVNKLDEMVNNIIQGGMSTPSAEQGNTENIKEEVEVLQHDETPFVELTEELKYVASEATSQGLNVYEVKTTLSEQCFLKSARVCIIFKELEEIGELLYSNPSVSDIEEEKFDLDFAIVFVTDQASDVVKHKIASVSDVEKVEIRTYQAKQAEAIQVVEKIEMQTEAEVEIEDKTPKQEESSTPASKQQVTAKSVRVNIERLDTLMNLVSELIIVKTQLEGIKESTSHHETNYNDSVEYLERVTTNLHDAVMKVRMVPVESVFNRFPRMIRDVSRKLGKDIELVMTGKETELDRTVIDEIGDPLIHLLRNAADHGLETTDERRRIGKDPKGTIKLQAYQDGNSVVIEVIDDGKGIDPEGIKQKSIKKGLITREEGETLSEQEILDLLFKPGFSTADAITDLSGRGVGLDVVKSKITALGGNVELTTVPGKGSTFVVRLPLTLAIIQALMVKIGDEKYAIPLSNIQNIEDVNCQDIKMVQKQEVIMLRDQVIPIIRLHHTLGIEEKEKDTMMAVIVKKGEKHIGFIIDDLIGQQEIVIKPLGKYLRHINIITGATILGNGEVALILDVNTLI